MMTPIYSQQTVKVHPNHNNMPRPGTFIGTWDKNHVCWSDGGRNYQSRMSAWNNRPRAVVVIVDEHDLTIKVQYKDAWDRNRLLKEEKAEAESST